MSQSPCLQRRQLPQLIFLDLTVSSILDSVVVETFSSVVDQVEPSIKSAFVGRRSTRRHDGRQEQG